MATPRGIPAASAVQRAIAEPPPALVVRQCGVLPYADALALQEMLVEQRRRDVIPDQLLLLEHPHVITLGTSGRPEHVLLDEADRDLLGMQLFETGRGGDVTYHGPGQLVGYPILDLKPDRCDLHRYVRDIEEVLIRMLADFRIAATRSKGMTGVWVNGAKIAAIGVRVSRGWITSHGFALNVCTDLRFFQAIVPCGLHDRAVTSMELCTGERMQPASLAGRVAARFAEVFGRRIMDGTANTSRKTC